MYNYEKEYYDYEGLWDPQLRSEIERERVKEVLRVIPTDVTSILDVGCGDGIFCNEAKKKGQFKQLVGMDRSRAALYHVQTGKVLGSIDKLPFHSSEFDLLTVLEVLEHLPLNIYENALLELCRVARKYILLTVPNNECLRMSAVQCPVCFTVFSRYFHLRTFNYRNLQELFCNYGFNLNMFKQIGITEVYIFKKQIKLIKQIIFGHDKKLGNSICPVCGFRTRKSERKPNMRDNYDNRLQKYIKYILSKYMPVQRKFKWILALYQKN